MPQEKYEVQKNKHVCHLRTIIKEELAEIELEGEIEFQKEKCERRVFDGKMINCS